MKVDIEHVSLFTMTSDKMLYQDELDVVSQLLSESLDFSRVCLKPSFLSTVWLSQSVHQKCTETH